MNKITNTFNPEEFRIIYHKELNNKEPILDRLCDETDKLQEKTDRKLITTLEGDIIEYKGEIYLAHMLYVKQNPINLIKKFDVKFQQQEGIGKAAKFEDVLSYLVGKYNADRPFELDVELKDNLSDDTLIRVTNRLEESKLPHYFASFYGKNLDTIYLINPEMKRARHVIKTFNDEGYNVPVLGMSAPEFKPDINIVQHKNAHGHPTKIMYTPEYTPEQLIKFSQEKNVLGAFTNIKLF